MSSPVITLTTDFGLRDAYVATMKGVILGIRPDAMIVDLSHDVPAHDIPHGAFVLGAAWRYFPTDTVHLAVVDPGVGSERHPLLVTTPGGAFVGPDNGLLTYTLLQYQPDGHSATASGRGFLEPFQAPVPEGFKAYVLDRDQYWLRPVSNTFHGRDIFAPVAAHLSAGVPPHELGSPLGDVVCLSVPSPQEREGVIEGAIIYVDGFGNLVSNIRPADVGGQLAYVEIEGRRISGASGSYGGTDGLLAIVGSHGYIEIAESQGSAAGRLGARLGTAVRLRRT